MKHLFKTILCCVLILIFTLSINAANKKQAQITRVDPTSLKELRVKTNLITADTCIVRHDSGLVWQIDSWVIGNELYKNYLDPSVSCPNPYPFTVTEINMPMVFATSTDIYVSVDIENVDLTNPNCPKPGDSVIALSSEWMLTVPGAGLYDIWIPLDTPVQVNGPFFAGFFISNTIDPLVGAAVITDENPNALCRSYNIWDETIGYIDLLNNSLFNFPGQLVLYAAGYPGNAEPVPEIVIIYPGINQNLFGSVSIWTDELSGSNIINYVSFEYSNGGAFIEVGRDYDGISPLRDGINPSGKGDGFSYKWDFSSGTEGTHILRATVYDTLGRSASDEVTVYLEPTPPTPAISSPGNGTDFCPPFDILMSCSDENLSKIDIYRKDASLTYSAGILTLNQFNFGDNNGVPNDGNSTANGEFGDYYSAPVAAALAVKLWNDRGYPTLMREGFTTISIDTLVERFAVLFQTRENSGNYDEDIYKGLIAFNNDKSNLLIFDYLRNPDYFTLRSIVEEQEKIVIIALGGTPGMWVVVDGFTDWQQLDGSYLIAVNNPLNGTTENIPMRKNAGVNEVKFNNNWMSVDMMISLEAYNWNINHTLLGSDIDGSDGWLYNWTPGELTSNNQYFIRAEGTDASGLKDAATILLNYDCSQFFTTGDYDNDGIANISDLNYLIDFLANNGLPPFGGEWRGDANCDTHVNITDIVYYINFIFGTVGSPCH